MTAPWTADELEAVFHAALEKGDPAGVVAALRIMVTVDPARCERLHHSLTAAIDTANAIEGRT